MDVLTAAWVASGSPASSPATIPAGACARCLRLDRLTPTAAVVSKSFTGYDAWQASSAGGLCPACCWAYQTPSLRQHAHLVQQPPPFTGDRAPSGPALTLLSLPQVCDLLTAGGPAQDAALIVPLKPGRKHLLPTATWAQVTIDDVRLTWTTHDAHRLVVALNLRARGFSARQLGEPAPPWTVLARLPPAERPAVLEDWARLRGWRIPASPWMRLLQRITAPSAPPDPPRRTPNPDHPPTHRMEAR